MADDWFVVQQPQLLVDGWIFYETTRYDPTIMRGYTPFVLPSGIANNPTNRRRLNRPFWLRMARTTAIPTDPWNGTLQFAAVSTLQPWIAGATAPFGSDDQVNRVGTTGQYLADWSPNPVVPTELDSARDTPTSQITKQYTGFWTMNPSFPNDWAKGSSNSQAIFDAMKDLFISINV